MKSVLLTFVTAALFPAIALAQSPRPAPTTTVASAMQGCWEMTAPNGRREWLIIGPTTARGQIAGGPAFTNAALRVAGRTGNSIVPTVTLPVNRRGARPRVFSLWMDDTNFLRIGGYWGPGEAEPDPEFTRCR
jgi:hypothetical protein